MSATAAPRPTWIVLSQRGRALAGRGERSRPHHPSARASPERCTAITPRAGAETPLRRRRPSRQMAVPGGHPRLPSHPATVRHPSGVPPRRRARRNGARAPAYSVAEHWPAAQQVVGKRSEPAEKRDFLPIPAHRRQCPLEQVSRACATSLAARAWRNGIGRAARGARTTRSRAGARWQLDRAAPPARAPGAHRQRGGDSDTSAACHPAVRRTGCRAPGRRATRCHRPDR